MLKPELRDQIVALMKREIVPAMGCTEPVAVALCMAMAAEQLGSTPTEIEVLLSPNVLKNAMGVGIPGTGMIGLPIAIALGALIGKTEYGLEVLKDVNDREVEIAKKYLDNVALTIKAMPDAPSKLHIDITARTADGDSARAVISGSHTNFVHISKGSEVKLDKHAGADAETNTDGDVQLTMRMVYDFASTAPVEEIEFIEEAARLNRAAAEEALRGDMGHSTGSTIRHHGVSLFGDTPVAHMLQYTSAACDARMAGAPIPVMSNSGSGNQGITATMPVVIYAEECGANREQTLRALTMSHLTSIYIKQSLGRLSALCGCVVASTGACCGIVMLMGGGYEQMCAAVKNMVANLTGMICDGAKPSCAMKISSSVASASLSAMLAMQGRCVTSAEGIISEDVDATIRNLTSIGRDAMNETDRLVLHIMTNK